MGNALAIGLLIANVGFILTLIVSNKRAYDDSDSWAVDIFAEIIMLLGAWKFVDIVIWLIQNIRIVS